MDPTLNWWITSLRTVGRWKHSPFFQLKRYKFSNREISFMTWSLSSRYLNLKLPWFLDSKLMISLPLNFAGKGKGIIFLLLKRYWTLEYVALGGAPTSLCGPCIIVPYSSQLTEKLWKPGIGGRERSSWNLPWSISLR